MRLSCQCNVQCAWRGILLKQLQIWSCNWAYWPLSRSLPQLIIDGVTWAFSVDLTAIIAHLNVVSWVNSVDPHRLTWWAWWELPVDKHGKARQGKLCLTSALTLVKGLRTLTRSLGRRTVRSAGGWEYIKLIFWSLRNILSCNLQTDFWFRMVTLLRLNNCVHDKTK